MDNVKSDWGIGLLPWPHVSIFQGVTLASSLLVEVQVKKTNGQSYLEYGCLWQDLLPA